MSFLANIMVYWMKPCIDTTGDAVEILRIYDEPIDAYGGLIGFHRSLKEGGGYKLTKLKTMVTLPTLYSNSYALKFNETSKNNWDFESIDTETKKEIQKFIGKCGVVYEDRLGFRERPDLKNYTLSIKSRLKKTNIPKAPPEIFTTHNAVLMLMNDGGIEKEDKNGILSFLDAHLEEFETEYGTGAGYKNVMMEKPKIPVTSYALDTCKRLTSKKEFENYLDENNLRGKIINFLRSNWIDIDGSGGFGISNKIISYHTEHALNILNNLGVDLDSLGLTTKVWKKPLGKEEIEEKIARGVENCFMPKNVKGHYGAFGMDAEREPNIFGTIEALKIFEVLDREDLFEKYRYDVLNFVNSFRQDGGFVGYIYHWGE